MRQSRTTLSHNDKNAGEIPTILGLLSFRWGVIKTRSMTPMTLLQFAYALIAASYIVAVMALWVSH